MPSLNLRNPLRRDPNRPTLKQRAAALKATAGRLIRKSAAATVEQPEAVDWYSPPPGFMAYPAIEPSGFLNIRYGIIAELERLRGIARAEYARREPLFRESFVNEELEARLSALHDELRLSALDAAIADPKALRADDAELIALGRAFDIATVHDREANDVATAAEVRAEARMPERPASLFFRVEDAPFCLREYHSHPEALAGQPVTPRDLGWMTRRPAEREIWVDAPPGSKGSNMVPGKVPQIVPWPEAQARIDEIKAAFKVWDLEKDRILEEEGSWDADEAAGRASDKAADLAQQIVALPARTADGMRVKLRVAAFYEVCDPDTQVDAGYPGEAAIRSLYRDTPGIEISADPSDIRIVPEAVGAAERTPSLSDQIIAGWRKWAAYCGPDETDADRAAWERVTEQRDALLDAAEALPSTLENLPAKALALAWLNYVQEWERGREREAYDITGGLAVDIDTAIVGRFRLVGHFRGA